MRLKQIVTFMLILVLLIPIIGCNKESGESEVESESGIVKDLIPSERAAGVWSDKWSDSTNGFADATTIYGFDFYKNGKLSDSNPTEIGSNDCKYIFFGEEKSRIVNHADGYSITLPTNEFKTDYSLSALRTRYISDNFVLTISKEDKNPYGNNRNGWDTYYSEWVVKYIDDLNFLSENGLRRTRAKQELTDLIDGYTVTIFNMEMRFPGRYEYPYYDIAIVRADGEYVEFYLFVMKSKTKQFELLDGIVESFSEFEKQGIAKNDETPYELIIPDYWSKETRDYYELLQNQTTVSWGAFSASMHDDKDSDYEARLTRIADDQKRLETAFDYKFDIIPTYTALSWGDRLFDFPTGIAGELAGGNGFNGKPVLQFTYQYTTLNNSNLSGYTPMFDIMNGTYDGHFRKLAQQIKAYEKPILFRLNNEMNTDWTSYAGIITLLDPDIFIQTWQRLYDIFREEGVDNCIWIFNPIAKTCPFSNWGEDLCYMPGVEYMQLMGLTNYEMNNGTAVESFEDMYKYLYNKNTPYFDEYPWIISEFGCGAGGETYYDWGQGKFIMTERARNVELQARWVQEMFVCFDRNQEPGYTFCKNIKAAIWFSVDDSVDVDGVTYINNYLQLNDELTPTLEAFRNGLKK